MIVKPDAATPATVAKSVPRRRVREVPDERTREAAGRRSALAVLAIWFGLQSYGTAVDSRLLQRDAAMNLQKKQQDLAQAAAANLKLEVWEDQSLPRDRELARSLYQNWLVAELNRVAEAGDGRARPRDADARRFQLPFTVQARGSLEQFSRWLAAFYKADHLHQIRDLMIQPTQDGSELQITASIETLVLHDATRRDKLNDA